MGFQSDSKAGTRNVQEYAADTVATLVTEPDPDSINVGFTADGHLAIWINGAWVDIIKTDVVAGATGATGASSTAWGATLPKTNPGATGAVWNNAGVVTISSG